MLLSMTGHGEAFCQQESVAVSVEVRTINSRFFKLTVRAADSGAALEARVEPLVREHVRRGTVQLNIRVDRQASAEDYQLNQAVLSGYHRQLQELQDQLGVSEPVRLELLLALPGVVVERGEAGENADRDWPLIQQAIDQALTHLAQMRAAEGRAMQDDLAANCELIGREVERIAERAPRVVAAYRERLTDRLNQLLAEYQVRLEPADVVREVGVYAERNDISEELVRLRSHLDQFSRLLESEESNGRKLDFLTQEMFRETNTIGSKANDAEIARYVVEIKAAIERMREMIQNVE